MRTLIASALCAVVFAASPLLAQDETAPEMSGGLVNLHGVITLPRGVFAEQLDKIAGGVGLDLAYAPAELPVVAGLSGNLSWYDGITDQVYVTMNRFSGWMPLSASGKLLTIYLVARMQPHTGVFRPFAELLGGLNVLWMDSSVDEEYQELGFSGDNILTDAGLAYGAGGGIEFRVYRGRNSSRQFGEVYVSLRARYIYGAELEYLQADAVSFDENGKPYVRSEDRMRSDIEMMQIMAGLTLRF